MNKKLHKLVCGAALGMLLFCGGSAFAQVAYTQGFDDDSHGWELEEFEEDDELLCNGAGALSANFWFLSDWGFGVDYGDMVSPSIGTSNGGEITVSYSYKILDFEEGAPTVSDDFGTIKAYYATSLAGPWVLFDTVDNESHVPSDECTVRTATFYAPEGAEVYVKIAAQYGYTEGDDFYIIVDDVNASQAAPVGCSAAPAVSGLLATSYSICDTQSTVIRMETQYTGTGYTYQWQSSADNVNFSDIANAEGLTYEAAPSATTWYRVVVTCSNGNLSTPSTPVRIISTGANCYCVVGFSGATEPMTRLDFAGIDNITSPDAIGLPGYEDFTNLQANLTIGQTYPIAVEGNTVFETDTNHYNVYIDWNRNGVLEDEGEMFYIGTITGSTGEDGQQATGSITVPEGALTGLTRMRVVKKYNTQGTACNTSGYGQAEDYTVNVQAVAAVGEFDASSFRYYPNPVKNVLTLAYTTAMSSVEVYNLVGQKVLDKAVNAADAQVDMSSLAAGAYLVKVNTANGSKTVKVVKQ